MFAIISEAFLLGLSTGIYCFSQCGIVIIPYVFSGEGSGVKSKSFVVLNFLSGRFVAYTLIGLLSGFIGQQFNYILKEYKNLYILVISVSYFVLAFLLIFNALYRRKSQKACKYKKNKLRNGYPLLLGLFTGFHICPPFVAATARAVETGNIFLGGLFFVIFFTATTIFILPLVFSGLLKNSGSLRKIARLTSVIAGAYLAVRGLANIIGM